MKDEVKEMPPTVKKVLLVTIEKLCKRKAISSTVQVAFLETNFPVDSF